MKFKAIQKNDRDVYIEDNRVIKIVDLLLNDDTRLYYEIINVINNIFNFDDFQKHTELLFKLYHKPKYHENLGIYFTFLWHIYADKTNCSNLRGALLERLVYKLLEEKYITDYKSFISCFVCIDSWTSSKTVDVFFYLVSEEIGESIECKVNPYNYKKDHIKNLKDIFIKSDEKILPSIISFSTKKALELRMEELRTPLGPIQLFGREDLKEFVEITSPILT